LKKNCEKQEETNQEKERKLAVTPEEERKRHQLAASIEESKAFIE
jgi:ribosomal protein S21